MYTPDLEGTRTKKKDRIVIIVVKDIFDDMRYTTGRLTGNTGQYNESFEVVIDHPYVDETKGYFHKEDLYEYTDENWNKYVRNQD